MKKILQTTSFKKNVKKLFKNQKKDLDSAVREIIKNPFIGVEKKGDLSGVFVYKFKLANQLTLLAYNFSEEALILLDFGPHVNFYRDLKSIIS